MYSRLLNAICVLIVVVTLCSMAESQYFGGGYGRPYDSDGYYVGGGGYGGGYRGGYGGGGSYGYGRQYDSDGYYTD